MREFADFLRADSYKYALISAALLLPVCIFSVYTFSYILFPLFRQKKYVLFGVSLILTAGTNCLIEWGFYLYTRPYTCVGCGTGFEMINTIAGLGINVASFLGVIALGIKFTKNWYLQQINNRMLARQKVSNEIKLLKARIQPEFLFETLVVLRKKIEYNKKQAAEMLLQFSELLSFTLYECDEFLIEAGRMCEITKEFIALENSIMKTNTTVSFAGDNVRNNYIPSFAVLPLLQHIFYILRKHISEVKSVLIEISTENSFFHCTTHIEKNNSANIGHEYTDIIDILRNRLQNLFDNNYTLNFTESGQYFSIKLVLVLTDFSTAKTTNKISNRLHEIIPV